jgi:hypothetical protein
MKNVRRRAPLAFGAALALSMTVPLQPAVAQPAPGAGNVGTAVYVVIHQAFTATPDADQCVGVAPLGPVRRGSSVILTAGQSPATPDSTAAAGVFHRSRVKDGTCQVLYIASAPVTPDFNVQFAGPGGELSPVFGPIRSEPVTDQPGIQQAVTVDLEFGAA